MARPFHLFFSDKKLAEIGPYVEPVGEEEEAAGGEDELEGDPAEDEEEHAEELNNAVVITEGGDEQVRDLPTQQGNQGRGSSAG